MPAPTEADIKAMDFSYLNGEDLIKYCPIQILQKQEAIDSGCLDFAVSTAMEEVNGALTTRFDLLTEYKKTPGSPANGDIPAVPDARIKQVVKLVALTAIRNITSNLNGIPENIANNFLWVDKTLLALRNGQMSIPEIARQPSQTAISSSEIINGSFKTLG